MNASLPWRKAVADMNLSADAARHGAQLAIAVVAAYLVSAAIGLPEGFWAVMSALIVVRPNTGATFGAGWDRIRGTLMGTACGLAGVWLRHLGLGLPIATLGVVAVLAFGSAVVPALRSAPITALIVVSSSGIAGHSPLAVAGLRAAEIAIGIAAGLAVTMLIPASRAAASFDREAAALLRKLADQVRRSMTRSDDADPVASEAAGAALRAELRRLAILAEDADRESRLFRRQHADAPPVERHRKTARLLARISQDAGSLGRMFDALPQRQHEPVWADVSRVAADALDGSADALLDPSAETKLGALKRIGDNLEHPQTGSPLGKHPSALLAGPVTLLLRDLHLLGRLTGQRRSPSQG